MLWRSRFLSGSGHGRWYNGGRGAGPWQAVASVDRHRCKQRKVGVARIVTVAAIYSASEAVVNRDSRDWRCSLEFELESDLAKSREEWDGRRGSTGPHVSDVESGSDAGERARAQALVGPLGLLGRACAGEAGGASWAGSGCWAGLLIPFPSYFFPCSISIFYIPNLSAL